MLLINFRRFLCAAIVLTLALSCVAAIAQLGAVKERSEIPVEYTWDLTALYKTDADWESAVRNLESAIPGLTRYEGKISKSPADLLACFRDYDRLSKEFENAIVYANMAYSRDTRDQKYSGYSERIQTIGAQFSEALSWFTPELVSIPAAEFNLWYTQKPDLAMYRHYIDDALRQRQYTLSPEEERILAMTSNVSRCPAATNTALCNSDLQFPAIKDENGRDVELSEGRASVLLQSNDKDVRRNASVGLLETYGKFKNTSAALMSGNMAGDVLYARVRNYKSCLHASLNGDNVDTTVYLNLIATVKKDRDVIQRYCDLRRRALKLDSIHFYDMYAPLVPETVEKVPYKQALATIEAAMFPLGKDYVDPLVAGFNSRWIDVYESKGKQSGAYSTSSYLSHPFILLNYNDTMDDVFTAAHELGHSMHTWFSAKHQPYIYTNYPLFTAEVASTFNEALLMDHLLKSEQDPNKKLKLINQYIDNIRGTVITQVVFADFELRMHRASEAGEPLTAENLGEMYLGTLRDYYGKAVAINSEYGYTWARIPHFYRNFYVYKYATAFCASQSLSQAVLRGDKGAKDKFIGFLSSGASDYPIDLLKAAGVDLTTPQPVEATMKKFGELVDEMERLLVQLNRI